MPSSSPVARPGSRRSMLTAGAVSVLLALGIYLLSGRGILERIELWTYDLRLGASGWLRQQDWARPGMFLLPRCDEVVVVTLDDRTEEAVPEKLPLSRRRFAGLIDAATQAGASVVVLDYFLPGRSYYDREQDQVLAEAITRSGRVILGRKVKLDEARRRYYATDSSDPIFSRNALDQGFLLAESDLDGVTRSINVVHVAPERVAPSLSLIAVLRHLKLKSRQVQPHPDPLRPASLRLLCPTAPGAPEQIEPIPVPLVDSRRLLLGFNTSGQQAPFPIISFIDFEGIARAEPERIRGKIVLVGTTTLSSHDRFVVPASWLPAGAGLPGVYLHALAMREMLWGTAVRRLDGWPRGAMLILLVLLGLTLFPRQTSAWAAGLLGLGWAGLASSGLLGLALFNVWIDLAGPALLWTGLFLLDQIRKQRSEVAVRRRFEILLSTYHMATLEEARAASDDAEGLPSRPGWNVSDLLEIRDFLAPPGYELQDVIGRGGMSVVFLGQHGSLDRTVAIKYLAPQLFSDPQARKRFLQEARVTAEVDHPNIVAIHDAGEVNGVPYIVLEYVPGDSLKQQLRRHGTYSLHLALKAVRDGLMGLKAAHDHGIVHRDVKSENLLVTEEGTVKLTDFGIAKNTDGGMMQTLPEIILGTPATMSPEQARGDRATPRSDLYSMGIVLYELVTGELPFIGETPTAILMKQIGEPPPPLDRSRPDAPPQLVALLDRALAKSPTQRFNDAGHFVAALDEVLESLGEESAHVPPDSLGGPAPATPTRTSVVRKPAVAEVLPGKAETSETLITKK